MRFKRQHREEWHDVFIIFPLTIEDTTVLLEYVQRRAVYKEFGFYDAGWVWEYRLKDENGKT